MIVLPRILRALDKPAIAGLLGAILVAVAIIGRISDEIGTGWAIVILVVGAINVVRAMPHEEDA
jgi:hypothetical protein